MRTSLMELLVKKLTDDAIVPFKAHPTDSGFDLFANEDVVIAPGETKIIKTGIAIQLPAGHEGQIRNKSGITSKTKLRVQLGTIDEPYRGELGVIVDNVRETIWELSLKEGALRLVERFMNLCFTVKEKFTQADSNVKAGSYIIKKGDKIAQLVIAPVAHPVVSVVDDLNDTDRGDGGFGSTGVTVK